MWILVPKSRAHELYKLLGPRFTKLIAFNAICGIEVKCKDITYAPRLRRFIRSFRLVDLAYSFLSSFAFLIPLYF
jgi:hypothetical protein